MVCHTVEFTMAKLQEKHYYPRLSAHLIEQLLEVDCNEFSRVLRAVDSAESGKPTTKPPRDFDPLGVLVGYGHLHYLRQDWAAGNLASQNGEPVDQSLDKTIDELAQQIVLRGGDPDADLEKLMKKFSKGMRKATGDWVLYRNGGAGREYLALAEHVDRGSPEELDLKAFLNSLA